MIKQKNANKNKWKVFLAWVLILAQLGGYGNTAWAAGTENRGLEESAGGTGLESEAGGDMEETEGETGAQNPETGDSTAEVGTDGSTVKEETGEASKEDEKAGESQTTGSEEAKETSEPVEGEGNAATSLAETGTYGENPNYSNLVIFVDFADTLHEHSSKKSYGECFKTNADTTFKYFNGGPDEPFGMRQYLYQISYGQLRVENVFPQYDAEKKAIVPYTLPGNEAYYAANEAAMVDEVVKQLNASGKLDGNAALNLNSKENKILDNLTIVVPCDDGKESPFAGHKADYAGLARVNGCLVRPYNVVTEEGIYFGLSESGLLIHEFLHTVGYPDLYRGQKNGAPVGRWDIMSSESRYLQYPLAYLRSAYTKWFEIPTVASSQKGVSLYAASAATDETKDRQALLLKTDYSDTEFFVVEYRRKGEWSKKEYEGMLPGSGLIIYRVNEACDTNITGPPDMLYVFRPGDKMDENGYEQGAGTGNGILDAYLSSESGRVSYGSSDFTKSLPDNAITYSDGTNSGIVISNVGSASGSQITFDITFTEKEEFWSTYAKEEGTGTIAAASCMGADGALYYLIEKEGSGGTALYRCGADGFTRLGAAPSGIYYKLEEYNGSLYAGYVENGKAKLDKWTDSSWQTVYTSPHDANGIAMASDTEGVYLSYVNADGSRIYAVQYRSSGISELGSQVCASTGYAANLSMDAENGSVVLMYREAFRSGKVFVKRYDYGKNAWSDVGGQEFTAGSGLVRLHNDYVYLMKNGDGVWDGDKKAYLYAYDLFEDNGSWEQLGSNPYAEVSVAEADLCFVGGRPYIAFLAGKAPYATEVKRLQNDQWTNLGGNVASEVISDLRMFAWGEKIYATYWNSASKKAYVRIHSDESAKTDEPSLPQQHSYRGTVVEQDGEKRLYISDKDTGARLSDAEILFCLQKNVREAAEGLFDKIYIVRTGDEAGAADKALKHEFINAAVPLLKKGGGLAFLFWDNMQGKDQLTQWYLTGPQPTDEDRDGNITADRGKEGSPWSLSLADTQMPAEKVLAMYSEPELESAYGVQTEAGASERPIYYYHTDGSGERKLVSQGGYIWQQAEGIFDSRPFLTASLVQELAPGTEYEAEVFRHDWRVEYGYAAEENGTQRKGSVVYFTSQEEAAGALGKLNLPKGTNVKARCAAEEQPQAIRAELLKVCAGNGLNLEFEYWDKKTKTTFIWKMRELKAGMEEYKDFVLRTAVVTKDALLPSEFQERSYVQITPSGELPFCEEVFLEIRQKGIAERFAGAEALSLWKQKGEEMTFLGNPVNYGLEDGSWLSFGLDMSERTSQGVAYVICTQARYGWQVVEGGNGKLYACYIENRSGKPVTGWEIVEGRKCYFGSDGYLAEGPAKIDGVWYLFGDYADGSWGLLTGYQRYQGHTYYMNTGGVMQKGWQKPGSIWHYFSEEESGYGQELPSTQEGYWVVMGKDAGEMAGRRYYFRNNAALLRNWQTIDGKRYFFAPEGYARTGWYPNISDKNACYLNELGQMESGYTKAGESAYYFFHTNGIRQYGWQKAGNVWHYFQPDPAAGNYGQEIPSENTAGYWYQMGGGAYYFAGNARLATGWQTIDGKRYYFDSQGRMCTGTWKIGSAFYHFYTEEGRRGVLGTGLFQDYGKRYYANDSGILQRGWQKMDGIWHFYNQETGVEEDGSLQANYWAVVSEEDGKAAKIFYFINGTRIATGWQTIEGRRYYFDGNGILQTGFFKIGNNIYYGREAEKLDAYPGENLAGEQKIGGKTYYFGTNYVMYVGWQKINGVWRFFSMDSESPVRGQEQEISGPVAEASWYWYTVNGEKYCFRSNSALLKGWQSINGQSYYLDPVTGAAFAGKTQKIGNYVYCFDEQGIVQKNTIVDGYGYNASGCRVSGWQKLNNEWFYFDASSKDPEDWKQIPFQRNGWWVTLKYGSQGEGQETGPVRQETYYFRSNASLVKGWQTIDGFRYYFDAKTGALQRGDEHGLYTIGANTYYLGQDGVLRYGWIREKEDGSVYYANTSSGALLSGWQKIDNLWYYFDTAAKKQDVDAVIGDDYFATAAEGGVRNTYYFINGTTLARGWQTIEGRRCYFDTSTCALKTGFFQAGKAWFYYYEDRSPKSGWWENPDTKKTYYFNGSGQAVTGWQSIEGGRYYFDADGVRQSQRAKIGSVYYFFGPDGKMRTGFVEYCDTTYYFNGNGQMQKGWQSIGGQRYYFDAEGAMQTGFVPIGTAVYYFDERTPARGQLLKGEQAIDGSTYYFNTSGVRMHGWQKLNGIWRFFDLATGKELQTKTDAAYWVSITMPDKSEERAFIQNGSTVLKGWQTIGGKRYYFDANGFLWTQARGWFVSGSNRYYFHEDGSVYQGFLTLKENDGTGYTYYLNASGRMQKGWQRIYNSARRIYENFYFGTDGQRCTGWQDIGGKRYSFDSDGVMRSGYVENADGSGKDYYFNSSGVMLTGWYRFQEQGKYLWRYFAMESGERLSTPENPSMPEVSRYAWHQVTERDVTDTYCIYNNGTLLKGYQNIGGLRYYFDTAGKLQKGWFLAGNSRCYSNSQTGAIASGIRKIGSDEYYFNANGVALTGWQRIYNSAKRAYENFYFGTDGQRYTGWQMISGKTYYFDEDGVMLTGLQMIPERDTETGEEKGGSYYFNANGIMQTGWFRFYENRAYLWRYFGADGKQIEPLAFDAVTPAGEASRYYTWYQVEEPAKGGLPGALTDGQEAGEKAVNWYCIYNNAAVLKGFYNIGTWRYYFDTATGILQRGHFTVATAPYYSEPGTGAINRSGLFYTDDADEIYYYDGNGRRRTGWLDIKSGEHAGRYYFNNLTGTAYRGGWFYVNNVRYLFDIEGRVRDVPVISSLSTTNYRTAAIVWKEAAGAKSYILEYSADAGFTAPQVQAYTDGRLSAEITGLEPGVRYYFRLKYTLESKAEERVEESAYSAVKNVVIQNESAPSGASATVESFALASVEKQGSGDTEQDSEDTETGIHAEFSVKGRLKSYGGDSEYYLVRVDTYFGKMLGSPLYGISKDDGVQEGDSFRFSVDMDVQGAFKEQFGGAEGSSEDTSAGRYVQMVMSGYALAVKSSANGYTLISKKMYVSNPEYTASSTEGYFHAASKKGIQGAIDEYLDETETKNTMFNLDIKEVIRSGPGPGRVAYEYKGEKYYFEKMEGDRARVGEWNQRKINVSCVILMSYGTGWRAELIRPEARRAGAAPYYMLNTTTQASQEMLEACFSYLGEIFGKDDCYVSNWILGNEINSCNAWNYKGSLGLGEYIRGYASAFRILYYAVVRTRPSSRAFISLDNAWNRAVAGYTGKQVLDSFASYINAESPCIAWNVAFHPYSAPLTRTDFWNDFSNTSNSVGSPFISMRNLDYFTGYLGTLEKNYNKEPGSIRVSLAEQGWTSYGCGENAQAEALARAYVIAEKNPRVDSFIIRAELDDEVEMRSKLYLGIRNKDHTKKVSCYVYTYMDAPNNVMQEFLNANAEAKVVAENVSKYKNAQNILRTWRLH